MLRFIFVCGNKVSIQFFKIEHICFYCFLLFTRFTGSYRFKIENSIQFPKDRNEDFFKVTEVEIL